MAIPGQDAPVDERRRHPDDADAQPRDQQQLDKVVEGDGEEPVHVASDEELHQQARAISRIRDTVKRAAWREAKGESLR